MSTQICMYLCIYLCTFVFLSTDTFLNITYSICIMLLVCMFCGLTIWYLVTNLCVLPWKIKCFPLLVCHGCLQFYAKLRTYDIPCPLWLVNWQLNCSAYLPIFFILNLRTSCCLYVLMKT